MMTCSQNMMDIVNVVDPSKMDSTAQLGATVLVGAASVIATIGILISLLVGNAAIAEFYVELKNKQA